MTGILCAMSEEINTDRDEHLAKLELDLLEQKEVLICYLKSKTEAEDFHAVGDAANDLREIEAKLKVLLLL